MLRDSNEEIEHTFALSERVLGGTKTVMTQLPMVVVGERVGKLCNAACAGQFVVNEYAGINKYTGINKYKYNINCHKQQL